MKTQDSTDRETEVGKKGSRMSQHDRREPGRRTGCDRITGKGAGNRKTVWTGGQSDRALIRQAEVFWEKHQDQKGRSEVLEGGNEGCGILFCFTSVGSKSEDSFSKEYT